MTNLEIIFLGIIQGLTEFLPVSSSGHLVIFRNLMGFKEPELLLDTALHLGTLSAICFYLRADIKKMMTEVWRGNFSGPYASLVWAIIMGTIPTAFIGLFFRDFFEKAFGSIWLVSIMLIITGVILIIGHIAPIALKPLIKDHGTKTRVGIIGALIVGIAQGMAIIPGISRSGATIVSGIVFGLDRELAGRFSFLLSIPAIVGALILQLDAEAVNRMGILPLLLGFVTSAMVGYLALKLLMKMIRKGTLYHFAPYCILLGIVILIFV
ncbi:MAG: undecaprenyl-diphosphate phosphatase [Deltaproteobacteria bacterium]|nr:undecaprenyl-diphosphate phosphatase [Deltaproteobacteria bacterium]